MVKLGEDRTKEEMIDQVSINDGRFRSERRRDGTYSTLAKTHEKNSAAKPNERRMLSFMLIR